MDIHRLTLPSTTLSLSLSELDCEYVKTALYGLPVRSTMFYAALALGIALHAVDGLAVWTTWALI